MAVLQPHTYEQQRLEKSLNLSMLSLSSILCNAFFRFSENRDKEFQLGPFFNLIKLRTTLPAAHFLNIINIGKSRMIEAINRGLSKLFRKINRIFLRSWLESFQMQQAAIQRLSEKQVLKPTCDTIPPALILNFVGCI